MLEWRWLVNVVYSLVSVSRWSIFLPSWAWNWPTGNTEIVQSHLIRVEMIRSDDDTNIRQKTDWMRLMSTYHQEDEVTDDCWGSHRVFSDELIELNYFPRPLLKALILWWKWNEGWSIRSVPPAEHSPNEWTFFLVGAVFADGEPATWWGWKRSKYWPESSPIGD